MTEEAGQVGRLTGLLEERYGSGRVAPTKVRHGLNPVYRVDRAEGGAWYIGAGRNLPRFTRALLFLEERAPRHGWCGRATARRSSRMASGTCW